MAVLRTLQGLTPGQLFPIEGDSAILGRHPDCDIVLEVGAVSRQHARIVRAGDAYYVEDLQSRNGTKVNDVDVVGRQKLADNDQLRICDLVFVFHEGQPNAAPPGSADQTGTFVLEDHTTSSSTVMSKLDVSTGPQGLRLTVNPEAKLKAVLEIGQNLGKAVSLNEVLNKVLSSLFTIFLQADRGFVVLRDPASGRLRPQAVKHRRESDEEQIRVSRTIISEVMGRKEAVLSADAATDSRFEMSESIVDFHIHSMMCAPLIASDGQVLGVIQIDTVDSRHRFNQEDLEVLASVAAQAAIAVENAQLHEMAVKDELFRRELTLAHEVQRGFLPDVPPVVEGYEFFDYYEPANHLGGDYFDYVPLGGGRLAIALADVSGKGISAALLVAKLSSEIRYCLASEARLSAAMDRLNRIFCASRWEDRFVTLALAMLDPATHEVSLVSAGHLPPLWRHADGRVDMVGGDVSGLPLGIDADACYGQCSIPLERGDMLMLYTDGLSEAMNASDELYGINRLVQKMAQPAEGVRVHSARILEDVRRFTGARAQSDDMCVTAFGRMGR